jgi:hypothetical protein
MGKEAKILEAVLARLRAHPSVAIVWRQTVGTFQRGGRWVTVGEKGMPDVMGMTTDGRLFGVEVKGDGGTVAKEQWRWAECISRYGGRAGIATSPESAVAIIETDVQCRNSVCGGRRLADTSGGEEGD